MTYAERKFKLSKQDAAKKFSKWAQKPDAVAEAAQISQAQRDLWDSLNAFVVERGGAIISIRHAWPIRLEVEPESKLPDKLREAGHDPIFLERDTRIGAPISSQRGRWVNLNSAYSFRTVEVYQVRLPK
jgi:hypothetical protein